MEASQNNQEQRPCRKCVDFYGTANTNFLCSKCYHEQAKEEQAAEVQNAAVEKAHEELFAQLPQQVPAHPQVPAQVCAQMPAQLMEEEKQEDVVMEDAVKPEMQAVAVQQSASAEEAQEEQAAVQTNTNKCWHCEKKVGILQVVCKCSYVYCSKHRHAEAHDCTFDYFAQNQALLEKNNPQIQHQKMVDRV